MQVCNHWSVHVGGGVLRRMGLKALLDRLWSSEQSLIPCRMEQSPSIPCSRAWCSSTRTRARPAVWSSSLVRVYVVGI